jgi:DEAD/DEAH box helicase domain-containing protein
MSVDNALQFILRDPRLSRMVCHVEALPRRKAVLAPVDAHLPEDLQAFLLARGIVLYAHQEEVLEKIRRGRSIVITTPTASGKSLAFNIPIIERLLRDPAATALYLYPTKALANDQMKGLQEIERFTGVKTYAAVYDGDTPPGIRGSIRGKSRIILTNPYELHQVLPWHHKWSRFFTHLNFIVIDEAHRYRGIFGSHVALLLRRFLRICRFNGAVPQFILSTATLANPAEFAERLTGFPSDPVTEDGSPRGTKHFILYNPYSAGRKGSTYQEAKDLLLSCTSHGLQTLCFTGSRKMAELVTRWAKEENARRITGRTGDLATYRAGYLPDERRQIERRFKEGTLAGVVSTNALELGIDIGSLDAVIIAGYPGTAMSTWQQAGRAGRRGGESIAVLVAHENPLDQYFMRNPGEFFGRPHENAVLDERNPYVASGHLLCAASELPLITEKDTPLFGPQTAGLVKSLAEAGLLRETPRGWVYAGRARATEAVRLGTTSAEVFRVVCNGRLLETMDRAQAYREAHTGAVLLHQGDTYLVQAWEPDNRTIRVVKTDVDYHTQPMKTADLTVTHTIAATCTRDSTLTFGGVKVTEQYTGYRVMKDDRVVAVETIDLPALTFATNGLWFTVPDSIGQPLAAGGLDFAGGLHGVEHALIGIFPLHVVCDRWDIGGLSTLCHPFTAAPTVFIYDGYEGGIGLAEKAFGLMPEIFRTTHTLLEGCPCPDGCPACVYSPKCGNDNQPLDKRAATGILRWLEEQWNRQACSSGGSGCAGKT